MMLPQITTQGVCHWTNQEPTEDFGILQVKSASSFSHGCGVHCIFHKRPSGVANYVLFQEALPPSPPPPPKGKRRFSRSPAKWMCHSNDLQSGLVKFTAAESDMRTPLSFLRQQPQDTSSHSSSAHTLPSLHRNAKSLTARAGQSQRMHTTMTIWKKTKWLATMLCIPNCVQG